MLGGWGNSEAFFFRLDIRGRRPGWLGFPDFSQTVDQRDFVFLTCHGIFRSPDNEVAQASAKSAPLNIVAPPREFPNARFATCRSGHRISNIRVPKPRSPPGRAESSRRAS